MDDSGAIETRDISKTETSPIKSPIKILGERNFQPFLSSRQLIYNNPLSCKSDFQIARRDKTIKHLELDQTAAKQSIKEQKEENGKLQARMQALHITSQSEQEVLNSEVARREELVNRYKLKHLNFEERNEQLTAKVETLESSKQQLEHQHSMVLRELDSKEDSLRQLQMRLQEAQRMQAAASEEVTHAKESLEHCRRDSSIMQEQLDHMEKSFANSEHRNKSLKEDVGTLQSQQKELLRRLASRDDMLHKVTVEATRLKEKY
uniref:Uncharacterized protein n=1 Tax=Ciona intestinalis TaxID=7719 RepID=H2XW86_CIOIN